MPSPELKAYPGSPTIGIEIRQKGDKISEPEETRKCHQKGIAGPDEEGS